MQIRGVALMRDGLSEIVLFCGIYYLRLRFLVS